MCGGGQAFGRAHERVASVAAGIHDGVVAVPHAATGRVGAQVGPDMPHWVQVRRAGRRRGQADVGRRPQLGVNAGRAINLVPGSEDEADVPAQLGFRLSATLNDGSRVQPSLEAAHAGADDPAQHGHGVVAPLGRHEGKLRHATTRAKKAAVGRCQVGGVGWEMSACLAWRCRRTPTVGSAVRPRSSSTRHGCITVSASACARSS